MEDRQYVCKERLGKGLGGHAWKAISPTGKTVAYKSFFYDRNPDYYEQMKERFHREIKTQAKLDHPNIVRVIDSGSNSDGAPFYVMDLAERSLQGVIDDNPGGMDVDKALEIFEQICHAMEYAHDQGVLHRDLKPQNVLIFGGVPKVADFGLVRDLEADLSTMDHSELIVGTHGYIAPEQMSGLHNAGKPADVYSLGKILYVMVTGSKPTDAVDNRKIPSDIRYVLDKCLAPDQSRRFSDCRSLYEYVSARSKSDASVLATPSEQMNAAIVAYKEDPETGVDKLIELFLKFSDDTAVYSEFLPSATPETLGRMALVNPNSFVQIVENMDRYADGRQPFKFCDTLANTFKNLFFAMDDIPMRRIILTRLLVLGYSHNRFAVGEVFGDLCRKSYEEPGCSELIAEVLRDHPVEREFFRPYLNRYVMPDEVSNALG